MSQYLCICVGAYWLSATLISKWPPCGHIGFFGFWTLTLVWLWISTPNLSGTIHIYMYIYIYMGRSLLIFSYVTFKMATWQPYWIFWFPDSNLFGFEYQLQTSVAQCLCIWVEPIDFQQRHFQNDHLAAILDFSVSGLCRWHGFWSVSQICFGISISNFICMLMLVIVRSLLTFSNVTFKMAAWWPYWIFSFPDSNFSFALNINSKLKCHNTYVYV